MTTSKIITRKNRKTKTMITLGSAEALGLCDGGGFTAWYTVCEDHDCVVGHPTRKIAGDWFVHADEWCDVCSGAVTLDPTPVNELEGK